MLKTNEKPMPLSSRITGFLKGQAVLLEYLACAICGFVLSNAFLLGQLAPFGVAFTAAGKRDRTAAAGAGSLLGYLFSFHPENNTRYVAAVVLTAAAKWLLPDRLLQKYRRWIAPAIAFGAVLLPGVALASLRGYLLYDVVICLSESVLAAGTCFFFQRALEALVRREKLATLGGRDISCLIITYALLVMALGSFTIADISVGRIIAVLTILLSAKCARESGGAIAGITAGVTMGVLSGDFTFLAASYGFGGMLAGMFAELGSVMQALIFVIVNGLTALIMARISTLVRMEYV